MAGKQESRRTVVGLCECGWDGLEEAWREQVGAREGAGGTETGNGRYGV